MKNRATFVFLTALLSFLAWASFLQAKPAVAAADGLAHAESALGDNLSITGPGPGADGSSKASGTSYGNVIDGNTSTIWGATGTTNQNIAVKWSSAVTANAVIIREQGNNISSWRLETGDGLALASGTTVGAEKLIQFQTTSAVKFRLVILSAEANPAISEFEVYNSSSTPGTSYQLSTSVIGQGSVSPASGTFAEGEAVSLTATPASGWQFSGWSGDASGTSNPLSLSMDANKNITATFTQTSTPPTGVDFSLVGYASLAGGTTGGAGGTSVTVSTGTDLQNAIKSKGSAPLTIYVQGVISPANSGALTKIDVKDVSDISILGAGAGAEFNGIGIKVTRASNIIIRNLKIHHVNIGDKDCISIEGPADHIWVDHCELYNEYQSVGKDYYDGLLDAKGAADYITFSWNYLHDSWKASLSGSSDSDNFGRRITYHHNFYENINSRLPLFRFGNGHVFNNYYKDVESSAINSRMGACVKIENNYFENVINPWVTAYSTADGYGDVSDNQLVNSTFKYSSDVRELPACSASIPYAYTQVLHSAGDVPSIVRANAGVGKIIVDEQSSARISQAAQEQGKPLSQEAFTFYPNPVEGVTTFVLYLRKAGEAKISLYSLQGALMQVVSNGYLDAGNHTIQYDHRGLKPGLYLYLFETEEGSISKKVLVK